MPEETTAITFEEFEKGLQVYKREDFENSSLPYDYLREYTHSNPVLYKQFLGVLLKRAAELEADAEQVAKQSDGVQLQLRWGYNTILRIAYEIMKMAEKPPEMIMQEEDEPTEEPEKVAAEQTDDFLPDTNPFIPNECSKKVDVLPLMCGAGKSTAISYIIDHAIDDDLLYSELEAAIAQEETPDWLKSLHEDPEKILRESDHYGVLIVTDRIKRLDEYLEPEKGYYGLLSKYIAEHKDTKTCMMTADTKREAEMQKYTRPVLLMTAQRYFSCSVEEINEGFLTWSHGQRGLVIFDEEPPIKEYVAITSTSLNDVDSALSDGIKDSADKLEKTWCIGQWEKVVAKLKNLMRTFEADLSHLTQTPSDVPCVYTYISPIQQTLTDDDGRFFRFVDNNKRELCFFKDKNCYSIIRAVYKAMTCGALFTSMKKKNGIRNSALGIVLDNTAKLTDINAHAVVLDGTADASPMYDRRYFFVDQQLGNEYRRSLNNLHLKFVDVSTSRARLKGDRAPEEMAAIIEYLNRDNLYSKNIPIFTYQFAEDMFVDPQLDGTCDLADHAGRIEHFGNIKGRNDLNDRNCIAQVGLFLKPPMYYIAMALSYHPELLERLRSMSYEESSHEISVFCAAHNQFESRKAQDLVADTEQNLFRGTIRNPTSVEPYTYYVFTSAERNAKMIEIAKERYVDARIEELPEPFEIGLAKLRTRSSSKKTVPQLILDYVDNLTPGTEFTIDQLLRDKDLTQGQFDKAKENNTCLKELFDYYRIAPGSRTYRKPFRA